MAEMEVQMKNGEEGERRKKTGGKYVQHWFINSSHQPQLMPIKVGGIHLLLQWVIAASSLLIYLIFFLFFV